MLIYMCVCMYVCVCVYIYIYTDVYISLSLYIYIYINIHTYIQIYICIYIYIYIYIRTDVHRSHHCRVETCDDVPKGHRRWNRKPRPQQQTMIENKQAITKKHRTKTNRASWPQPQKLATSVFPFRIPPWNWYCENWLTDGIGTPDPNPRSLPNCFV